MSERQTFRNATLNQNATCATNRGEIQKKKKVKQKNQRQPAEGGCVNQAWIYK